MQSKLALLAPPLEIRYRARTDKSLISLDLMPSGVDDAPTALFNSDQLEHLRSLVAGREDIFDRWGSVHAPRQVSRSLVFGTACRWMLCLRQLQIDAAVLFTGSAHHPATVAFDLACQTLGIPRIYLYSIDSAGLSGRLLPLLQTSGISSRRRLNCHLSEYDYEVELQQIAERSIASNLSDGKPASLPQTFLSLLRERLAVSVKGGARQEMSGVRGSSLLDEVRFLGRQQRSLSALKRFERNYHQQLLNCGEAPKDWVPVIWSHFQPESTTEPEGGSLTSHVDLVHVVRSLGYSGPIIVREHPATRFYSFAGVRTRSGVSRSVSYYESLRDLGCAFLPPGANVTDATGVPPLPITITGSIAIERGLRGLPSIVTGFPWYRGLPAAQPIDCLVSRLPPNVASNESLALCTRDWLREQLDFKTLCNPFAIGSGTRSEQQEMIASFWDELRILLEFLRHYVE